MKLCLEIQVLLVSNIYWKIIGLILNFPEDGKKLPQATVVGILP